MAVAFRSIANTTYGSRTNTTVSAPAGIANNDILLLHIFAGAAGTAPTVTPPSGFNAVTGSPIAVSDSGFAANVYLFWKRASSESGSYTATHSTGSTQASISAYSGCETSGSPIDASSANSGTGQTTTATGITTSVANTVLAYSASNWEGSGSVTPPTGYTERFDGLIYDADKAQAAAGATGNLTHSSNGNVNSTEPWTAFLVALKPPGATGANGTLSQSIGTISLSAAGTVAVSGTLSKSIGSVGLSATGAVPVTGSLSQSIGAISLTATGSAQSSGVLSQSIGAIGLSASGTVAVSGALIQSIGAVALAASGTLAVAGVLSQSIGAVSLTATGQVAISGVLSASIGEIALDAAGSAGITVTGNLNQSIGEITLSGDGIVEDLQQPIIIDYHDGVSRKSDWEVQAETAKKDRDALREIVERAFDEAMGGEAPVAPLPTGERKEIARSVRQEVRTEGLTASLARIDKLLMAYEREVIRQQQELQMEEEAIAMLLLVA